MLVLNGKILSPHQHVYANQKNSVQTPGVKLNYFFFKIRFLPTILSVIESCSPREINTYFYVEGEDGGWFNVIFVCNVVVFFVGRLLCHMELQSYYIRL